jgi:MoxR-like ATPase
LKRRCLYHWIDYPQIEHATAIVRARVPGATVLLTEQVTNAVQRLRSLDVQKQPGIAEAIDWVSVAMMLGLDTLTPATADQTLGTVLKYREDHEVARERLDWVVNG